MKNEKCIENNNNNNNKEDARKWKIKLNLKKKNQQTNTCR